MQFNLIDIDTWSRKPYFEHFLNNTRCTYSMTANIDITALLAELKRKDFKLYPALIHMLSTVVNSHQEFRTSFDSQGRVGYWDTMVPSYTVFHADDKTFTNIWTEYSRDFGVFCQRYLEDQQHFGPVKRFIAKPDEPPNSFPISCIPWVSFTGFNLNIYTEGTYLTPIFTIGRYFPQTGKTLLPLSVQPHHAVCDGYHTSLIFNEMQMLADNCMDWLPSGQ